MKRRPLLVLDEVIARRKAQMKRVVAFVPLTSKDPFAGPPDPETEEEGEVDALIRRLASDFDFSLLMSGDRRYTRQLAEEFSRLLTKTAITEGIDRQIVRDRMTMLLPWLLRGFRAFHSQLRTSLKILRDRPV